MSKYVYVNSRGESIDLCRRPLWVASFNPLRSYAYERVEQNGYFFGYTRRKNVEKQLTVQYYGDEFYRFRDEFYRITNYDVVMNAYGRLYDGDWFAVGNFPTESIDVYDKIRRMWTSQIGFFVPEEVWRREVGSFIFTGDQTDPSSVPAIPLANYPSNYPHGYVSGNLERIITNDAAFPCPFTLTIEGACSNPAITISAQGGTGHVYNVNAEVGAGERLIIDSMARTIGIYDAQNNLIQNAFADQNHDADKYIFEPLPVGDLSVRYQNIPSVTLTIYEERSAAKWS